MTQIREMSNPSGADVEAYVNQRLAAVSAGASASKPFKASDYDIQVSPANVYPGEGWEFVTVVAIGIHALVIWRIDRVEQARLKQSPVMPLVTK